MNHKRISIIPSSKYTDGEDTWYNNSLLKKLNNTAMRTTTHTVASSNDFTSQRHTQKSLNILPSTDTKRTQDEKVYLEDTMFQLSQNRIIRPKQTFLLSSKTNSSASCDNSDSSATSFNGDYNESIDSQDENTMFIKREIPENKNNTHSKFESRSYRKYNLMKQLLSTNANKSASPTHLLLPKFHANNEKYKINLYKYLRKPKHPDHRTDKCKQFTYMNKDPKGIEDEATYFVVKKKKKVNSCTKNYQTEHYFQGERRLKFKFYFDYDIGFSRAWQTQWWETEMDDDAETDEEQLYYSDKKVVRDIREGINLFEDNKRNCKNLVKFHYN